MLYEVITQVVHVRAQATAGRPLPAQGGAAAEGRGTTPEAVENIAEGRVWTGERAKELGLVDSYNFV